MFIAFVLFVGISFIVISYNRGTAPKTTSAYSKTNVSDNSSFRTYTDSALHFSVEVLSRITDIKKMGQGISFGESSDGP